MGQYGYGRVPAYLTFELELMWDKVSVSIDELFGMLVADGAVQFDKPNRYAMLFLLSEHYVEA